MAPANPPPREPDGVYGASGGSGGGAGSSNKGTSSKSGSTVPGRIGRPPQWTSTRARKLVRLYMYSTLSVDKILKVLEDDVFKPRKNSAQKTIHNMLDHDPRYLRPESREDMNHRVRLLAESTQRKRRSWKKRDNIEQQLHQEHNQHQQQHQHQPHFQHQHQHVSHQQSQPHLPPPMGHAPSYSSGIQQGVKQEMSHVPQPPQPQYAQYHQQYTQHQQHPGLPQQLPAQQHHISHHLSHQYSSQPAGAFLPPPQSHQLHQSHQPHYQQHQHQHQHQSQQPYHEFYQQQYHQQQPSHHSPQHHPYPLSMQQMTHSIPQYVSSGWSNVYENQSSATDPASRLPMSASFDLTPHQPSVSTLHTGQQQHGHAQQHLHQHHLHQQHSHHPQQHQNPHAAQGIQSHHSFQPNEHGGYDAHTHFGTMGGEITSSHVPSFGEHQRQRRISSAAYSTDSDASSDVSTETIDDLKSRMSGCSTHYANQIMNLLRRFTISDGSDDATLPTTPLALSGQRSGSNDNNADPHRIRKLWRQQTQKYRSGSVGSVSSSASFDVFDSDVDVYGETEEDEAVRRNESNPASPNGLENELYRRNVTTRRSGHSSRISKTTIVGASGDNAGNPRFALPGDFLSAYHYRDDDSSLDHDKLRMLHDERDRRQREVDDERKDRRTGGNGGNRANIKAVRESRDWSTIAHVVGAIALKDGSFWVLEDGQLTPEAQAMLHEQSHQHVHLTRRDRFGHSLLHLLASRDGQQMQLLNMVLNSDDATLMAANTAGQTFLHLLAPGWFVGLQELYSPLIQLLAHLRSRTRHAPVGGSSLGDATDDAGENGGSRNAITHLIYAADVYGRSFFHRLGTFVKDPNVLMNTVGQHYDQTALMRRDAFTYVPIPSFDVSSGGGNSAGNTRLGNPDEFAVWQQSPAHTRLQNLPRHNVSAVQYSGQTFSPRYDDGGSSQTLTSAVSALGGGNVPSVFSSEDVFIRHHESLVRIVNASVDNTSVEDSEGRNSLHCLAEAIVDKRRMDEHCSALSSGRKPPKKKTFEKRDPHTSMGVTTELSGGGGSFMSGLLLGGESGNSTSGGGPIYSSSSPYLALSIISNNLAQGSAPSAQSMLHTPADEPEMAQRLRLVQGLLSPPFVVDVNHYDRRGQTVLIAFVVHIPDDQEDKAKSLVAILEALLSAGAQIEGRNRRGETALLVAARLGRKIALTALLDHGANVHARDAAGRGILDVLDMQCRRHARHNVALYGRLEACRVLLTGIKQLPLGVKQRPTLLDEWTLIQRRGPEPRDGNYGSIRQATSRIRSSQTLDNTAI